MRPCVIILAVPLRYNLNIAAGKWQYSRHCMLQTAKQPWNVLIKAATACTQGRHADGYMHHANNHMLLTGDISIR